LLVVVRGFDVVDRADFVVLLVVLELEA